MIPINRLIEVVVFLMVIVIGCLRKAKKSSEMISYWKAIEECYKQRKTGVTNCTLEYFEKFAEIIWNDCFTSYNHWKV